MDAGFLNFHKEEDFSSYFLDPCADDSSFDGTNSNSVNGYHWDWDNDERELNGDVGLIPISSHAVDFCPLSSSPPSREDFNKLMTEWQHLVNLDCVDDSLAVDVEITSSSPPEDLISPNGFDITKYVEEKVEEDPKPRLGGKRIDMVGRRYLIDENEENEEDDVNEDEDDEEEEDDITVDVETVTESISQPVLQAGDLKSLLEQFEATENTNLEIQQSHSLLNQDIFESVAESPLPLEFLSPAPVKCEKPHQKVESSPKGMNIEDVCISPTRVELLSPIKTPKKEKEVVESTKVDVKTPEKTKVTVPAIEENFTTPTKDQVKNKQILDSLPPELIDRIRQSSKRKPVPVIPPIVPAKKRLALQTQQIQKETTHYKETKSIQLDHDYCSNTPRKDSGFSSCEEDDRSILRTQPTVKNADGKLMVSLLKTNTIKKKLNLEEYKKRLLNRSQHNSGNNSPAPEEDENMRRLRHQEKLMQMAQEIISQQNVVKKGEEVKKEVKPIEPPSNMVMKTLVSVGTNTEESWGHLEQILQNTQIKISPNSLISSIVEHLPKVKPVITKQVEHGEDKTIVYLDKTRDKPKTRTIHVQTTSSCSTTRRRRRTSSSSSNSSTDSSISSSSRESSRSRTPSPVRKRHKEQMKVVEERRVIYVGRIADNITKEDLRKRFQKFGPITNVSVHFRRRADNYGFVTFMHKEDAYEAVERGNEDKDLPEYDLSFGGRRLFCQTTYADLDNVKDDVGYWSPITGTIIPHPEDSFDNLLRQAQAKLRNRQL